MLVVGGKVGELVSTIELREDMLVVGQKVREAAHLSNWTVRNL